MKYKPLTFAGMGDPTEAEEWFKQMEDIFDIMGVEGEMRVKLAAFRLADRARYWWKDVKARLTTPKVGSQDIPKITWKIFEEEFNDKYFPEIYRNVKRQEFLSLTQGEGVSVEEYEAQFTALSRFATRIVEDEYGKCRQFQNGLHYSIRNKLTALDLREYNVLVNRAKMVERDTRESRTFQQQK